MTSDNWRWFSLILVTLVITVAFFGMTQSFLMPLALAAICGAIAKPLNMRLVGYCGGRKTLGSVLTLILLILLVFGPIFGLIALALSQAAALIDNVSEVASRISEQNTKFEMPEWVPIDMSVEELRQRIIDKMGAILQAVAGFFVASLSQMTVGAAVFFLHLFVFFYALFFFLQMNTPIMVQILRFTGLKPETQSLLNERIVSVSRATIKGTLTIAFIQGSLGGISFWVAGIEGAAFWTVVMMVAAVLPGLGAPFVIFGGAAYLALNQQYLAAIGLAVWAGAVVSTIDNILRPTLVGRDAKLHDVMILVSTLGGLGMFGAAGLVLGPVLAGLFVTIWQTLAEAVAQPREADADPVPVQASE